MGIGSIIIIFHLSKLMKIKFFGRSYCVMLYNFSCLVHYRAIFWNVNLTHIGCPEQLNKTIISETSSLCQSMEDIHRFWFLGFFQTTTVTHAKLNHTESYELLIYPTSFIDHMPTKSTCSPLTTLLTIIYYIGRWIVLHNFFMDL